MAGLVGQMAFVSGDDEFAGIGGALRVVPVRQLAPTFSGPLLAEPLELGVGEKDLAVLGWAKYINS
jgi:hypothetical protein